MQICSHICVYVCMYEYMFAHMHNCSQICICESSARTTVKYGLDDRCDEPELGVNEVAPEHEATEKSERQ